VSKNPDRVLPRWVWCAMMAALSAIAGRIGLLHAQQDAVINANPSNYRALLPKLRPGETLNLEAGQYPGLPIRQLNGRADAWITISGPPSGAPAVIVPTMQYSVVDISNSSYVAIQNLRIDSRGLAGAFGISTKGYESNVTHDIRIEKNTLVGQNGSQQTDGISTKTPTWGWIIRYNRISGAGTGMYLGDSDGNQPFVGGLIENNLIEDTIGYDMEIKDQNSLPPMPGIPLAPTSTIIRNNVFIKNDQPSPDGDRPNVILGSFPPAGPGALNLYEVYGNYFLHNHREALFQASGRVSVHDNIFVDGPYDYPAVVLRKQRFPLKLAHVYNNTIYTGSKGIYFGSGAEIEDAVVGNLVFAITPISGQILLQSDNLVDSADNAAKYVKSPSFDRNSMDFYPLPGRCEGKPIDLSEFHTEADYTLDFNGAQKTVAKGAVLFRGAYAGEGSNSGWALQPQLKPPPVPLGPSMRAFAPLVWIEPSTVASGRTTAITLFGANFSKTASVSVSGSGVTVAEVAVESPTEIHAKLQIAPARSGSKEITVTNADTRSNALTLHVTARRAQGGSH
jgi:hypothetical protein